MYLGQTRRSIQDALAWGYLQKQQCGIVEYLTYLCKIQKSSNQYDPNLDFLEAGYICAAIHSMPPEVSGWIEFSYGPDDSKILHASLTSTLRFKLFPMSTPRKHERLMRLAETALEDYRLGINQEKTYPITLYIERMGVNSDQFERDWGESRRKCLQKIRSWDADGIGQVGRMVGALRDEHAKYRPTELLNEWAQAVQQSA